MEYAYLGIDIAKRKFDVALRLPDARVRVKAFANDATGYAALRAGSRGTTRVRCTRAWRPRAPTVTGWRRPSPMRGSSSVSSIPRSSRPMRAVV